MSDFPYFELAEHHLDLREAVPAVAENAMAPYAADVATARFPREAYDALAASGFHAPHVPETYGARAPTRRQGRPRCQGVVLLRGCQGFDNDTAMRVTVDCVRLLAKPDQ